MNPNSTINMTTHASQEQQTRTNAAAIHITDSPDGVQPYLADQRPGAAIQRHWQQLAENSPRVQQLKAWQAVADQPLQRQGVPEEEEMIQGKFETVQRQGVPEEEEMIQGKFQTLQRMAPEEEEEPLQGKFIQRKANDTGLPDHLKSGIENLSGIAMDDVKVHFNSARPAPLQAHAFTQGADIHVAPGQEKHLAHEAWHVVQQKQGRVQPTMSLNGQQINDSPALEQEADHMGARALSNPPAQFRREKE